MCAEMGYLTTEGSSDRHYLTSHATPVRFYSPFSSPPEGNVQQTRFMYTTTGKSRSYVVLKRDESTPLIPAVDATANNAALTLTASCLTYGGAYVNNMFTETEFRLLAANSMCLFKSAAGLTTVIDFENGPHGARRRQIKLGYNQTQTHQELRVMISTLETAISRLAAVSACPITESLQVYWVSLVRDPLGEKSDGQLFHSDRDATKDCSFAPLPVVLHIPLTTEGSRLDVLPGSHFQMLKYDIKAEAVPMARVNIAAGQTFLHFSDLMHAGVGGCGVHARERLVVLMLPKSDIAFQHVLQRDEVALTKIAYSAATLDISSKPLSVPAKGADCARPVQRCTSFYWGASSA